MHLTSGPNYKERLVIKIYSKRSLHLRPGWYVLKGCVTPSGNLHSPLPLPLRRAYTVAAAAAAGAAAAAAAAAACLAWAT